jgi:hypothetical protein
VNVETAETEEFEHFFKSAYHQLHIEHNWRHKYIQWELSGQVLTKLEGMFKTMGDKWLKGGYMD